MEIEVLSRHINEGTIGNCYSCPIALAINAILKEKNTVSVSSTHVFLFQWGVRKFHSELPDVVKEFIKNFDSHHGGQPFKFSLDIPEELIWRAPEKVV